MRRGRDRIACALMGGLALGGCVQATRHSNTMVFGTNTQFGIRAGVSAANVPEINVGYARQEAVVMPLVANARDNGTYQTPCDPSQPIDVAGGARFAIHPCLLVAVNGSAQDSYSVLASFGAQFDGSAQVSGTSTKGGLAQYFATGMAAQLLALNGGASVVAVGQAAEKSAENKPTASTVGALFGNETVAARGVAMREPYQVFRRQLLAKVELTAPANIAARMSAFEAAAAVTGQGVAADCTSIDACRDAIVDNDAYRNIYNAKQTLFDQALVAWQLP